jgi:thiamine pyrophosphate-dependent acetolactate synthase large subunit-like protein
MAKKKVADLLVDVLAEAGVRQICGVSSDSLNGITDGAQELLGWFGGYGS